jgi:hypothetical protein
MINRTCWGILRETSHSPGREDDDAAILRAVGAKLAERGFTVTIRAPEDADDALTTPGARIFSMCEEHRIIEALRRAERAGAVIVNRPGATQNTDRHNMIALFEKARVSTPHSRVSAADPKIAPPAAPVWVKRYDFHATQANDVLFAGDAAGWRAALGSFADRGIPFVIVQDHVPGDLIKFYGVHQVGTVMPSWFAWFYHKDQTLAGHAFDETVLRKSATAAASALGVEVFGGDAIVGADGRPMIIDLNAWPSFARYRAPAAEAIAEHLAGRFSERAASAAG